MVGHRGSELVPVNFFTSKWGEGRQGQREGPGREGVASEGAQEEKEWGLGGFRKRSGE